MSPLKAGDIYQLSPLVRRITAPNPGPLTGPGTNTYIIGASTVIDPGPDDRLHINAILQATGHRIEHILVTHTHDDHSPAAAKLAELTGAKLFGCYYQDDGYQDKTFKADIPLHHNEILPFARYSIQAIHTPGHVGNHFCLYLREEGMLFSGDHIMEGSTVVIIPPGGDMADYIASLELLRNYPLRSIAPGHGELITQPMEWIDYLIRHRLRREQKVINAISALDNGSIHEMIALVYDDVDPAMHDIARISLWAHLLKLEKEGRVKNLSGDNLSFIEQRWQWLRQVLE